MGLFSVRAHIAHTGPPKYYLKMANISVSGVLRPNYWGVTRLSAAAYIWMRTFAVSNLCIS